MEAAIKDALADGSIRDSLEFAESKGFAHAELIGVCKSLASGSFIVTADVKRDVLQLTKEGAEASTSGSPEARVFALVPADDGILQNELEAKGGAVVKVGLQKAVPAGWLEVRKEEVAEAAAEPAADGKAKKPAAPKRILRKVASVTDTVQAQLKKVLAANGALESLPASEFEELKKRKLVQRATIKSVSITPGPMFASFGKKAVTDITHEMLVKGTWKEQTFKPLNFDAAGKPPSGGALHPLMKVKSMFREIFLEMGFEEMRTNKYVGPPSHLPLATCHTLRPLDSAR